MRKQPALAQLHLYRRTASSWVKSGDKADGATAGTQRRSFPSLVWVSGSPLLLMQFRLHHHSTRSFRHESCARPLRSFFSLITIASPKFSYRDALRLFLRWIPQRVADINPIPVAVPSGCATTSGLISRLHRRYSRRLGRANTPTTPRHSLNT